MTETTTTRRSHAKRGAGEPLEAYIRRLDDPAYVGLCEAQRNAWALCDSLRDVSEAAMDRGDWAFAEEISPAWADAVRVMCAIGGIKRTYGEDVG